MSPKSVRVIYWITTVLFALFMLFGGVTEVMQNPTAVEGIVSLGYPAYFLMILGIAKVLGSIAIVQNKYKTIKEWAYAGFTIDILSASASLAYSGAGIGFSLFPLVFLAVMFVSYASWKKTY